MRLFRLCGILILLGSLVNQGLAQSNYTLQIQSIDSSQDKTLAGIIKNIPYKKTFPNKLLRTKELQSFLFSLYDNGYIAASIDSIKNDSLNQIAYLNLGLIYHWAKIEKGNVDEGILSETGFREKVYFGKIFNQMQVRTLQEKILNYCENNGFPFASIKLDSIKMDADKIYAKLNLTKNILVKVDSIIIKGNAELSEQYLYNYLGIKPGDLYNESLVIKIPDRLKELPFLNVTQKFKVIFLEKNCKILLYIDNKKASQFDGVVGIAPNTQSAVPGGTPSVSSVRITGQAHLRLNNSYGHGELFDLNWQEPQPQTQDLKVQFNYPFLAKSPFGLDVKFSLFKQDTSYLNLDENIGLQYLLSGGNYFKVFYEHTSSTIISAVGLDSITVLPSYADVSCNHYGIGYRSEKLDYRLNPRSGYSFEASASYGFKTINKNPNINPEVYDSLKLTSTEYKAEYSFDYYFPLSLRNVIDIGAKGGVINSPDLFQNELYRFGGLQTLRGFDELSIYASNYEIWKVEFRYIMEQNSYLFVFYNQAWYVNQMRNNPGPYTDTPYGFGVGSTFQSKLGIMSVSYALGSELGNPIAFKSGKISFGLVNYF
jgi:outer membrane protein assembly factor BamA